MADGRRCIFHASGVLWPAGVRLCIPAGPLYAQVTCHDFVGAGDSKRRCARLSLAKSAPIVCVCVAERDLERHRRPKLSARGNNCLHEIYTCLVCCFMPAGRIKCDIREPKSLKKM